MFFNLLYLSFSYHQHYNANGYIVDSFDITMHMLNDTELITLTSHNKRHGFDMVFRYVPIVFFLKQNETKHILIETTNHNLLI